MTAKQTLFAPGCALRRYKPELIDRMTTFLLEAGIISGTYLPCCKDDQVPHAPVTLITCCPGCEYAFGMHHTNISTISLWKVLLNTNFPFPDYHHETMSIHDSCHSRNRHSAQMQTSVRTLCKKMRIELAEPSLTLDDARCCGGCCPDPEERKVMARRRADDFPADNVVVYCTGCTRSLSTTHVHPRHMLDLIYQEPTQGLTLKTP